jgi:hypothetical protein
MRVTVIVIQALLTLFVSGAIAAGPFSGVWGARACGKEKNPDYCGGFYLTLTQVGDRICGDHSSATVGLGRLNEGAAQSVRGRVIGNTAVVVIKSGRDGTEYLARATRNGNFLDWRLLEELKPGGGPDSPLIWVKGHLRHDKPKEESRVLEGCKTFYDGAL